MENTKTKLNIDYVKIQAELESMTGHDFEKAEQSARMLGDRTIDLALSRNFHAILAAKALQVPIDDIKDLPIRDYQKVTSIVASFLFQDLEGAQVSL